jgi:hypothetical protein
VDCTWSKKKNLFLRCGEFEHLSTDTSSGCDCPAAIRLEASIAARGMTGPELAELGTRWIPFSTDNRSPAGVNRSSSG